MDDHELRRFSGAFSGVLMALIVFFVVLPLGSCMACMVCAQITRETRTAHSPPAESTSSEPAVQASAAPIVATTAPTPTEVRCSFAVFMSGDEHLGVCVDNVISFTVPLTDVLPSAYRTILPPSRPHVLDEAGVHTYGDYGDFLLRDDVTGLQSGGDSLGGSFLQAFGVKFRAKEVQLLDRRCEEMFSDRVELASCDFDMSGPTSGDAGIFGTWGTAMRFYSLDALNGDTALHGCLKKHGAWKSLPHDSYEYRRTKIRQDFDRVNRELEKIRGVTQ